MRCPNCQGNRVQDRVQDRVAFLDPRTGASREFNVFTWIALVALALWLLFLLVAPFIPQLVAFGTMSPGLISGGDYFAALFGGIFAVGFFGIVASLWARRPGGVKQHNYSCLLCGFRWRWRADQPYQAPNITLAANPARLRAG